jgi:hypothetical protein
MPHLLWHWEWHLSSHICWDTGKYLLSCHIYCDTGPLSREGSLSCHVCCVTGKDIYHATSAVTQIPWAGRNLHHATSAVTRDIWARRDLYHATSAVTQDLWFWGLFKWLPHPVVLPTSKGGDLSKPGSIAGPNKVDDVIFVYGPGACFTKELTITIKFYPAHNSRI